MNNSDLPAMPVSQDTESVEDVYLIGLTKREYFAAKALQGLCSEIIAGVQINTDVSPEQTAVDAVFYADALLKKLEETK